MGNAIVTNIQGYSIHDGPGIRTVVFLKGCPLRCCWCANPETLSAVPEVGFFANRCKNCGRCENIRTHADSCFYNAIVEYGEELTSEALYDKVWADKMFYDASGGGVTFSGGEPLLYPDFIREVSEKLYAAGIDICIETCGAVPWSSFEAVLPFTNRIYYDLKLMDSAKHREFTGANNTQILDNAKKLAGNDVDIIFRRPLIPGVNDSVEEINETAKFLLEIGVPMLELMPYHRMGHSKYAALDMEFVMEGVPAMNTDTAEIIREAYNGHGLTCTIS